MTKHDADANDNINDCVTLHDADVNDNINDCTVLIERVEPSSFAAGSDRLPVHLSSSSSGACPGDTQTTTKSSNVRVVEPEQVERQLSQEKEAETLEFESWPIFEKKKKQRSGE